MRRTLLVPLVIAIAATTAGAQEPKWDVELYGGGVVGATSGKGTSRLPAAGPALVTSTPIFPSRQTSSWLFGDGAQLLNGVNEAFDVTARIVPLDGLLSPASGGRGALFGVRLHRRLNGRLSAEFAVDAMPSSSSAPHGLADAVEATRRSFVDAFSGLLATGPFSAIVVDATAASDAGSRRDVSATGAINVRWGAWHGFSPFATAGAGILAGSGSLASAQLTGHYGFKVAGEIPIAETDAVAIRFERPASLVLVLGGGLRRDLSGRWGITFDVRVLSGPDRSRILIDAQPTSAAGTPAGFVESFTNPAIQFSNDPSTGRRSSLSGAALNGVEVFSGGTRTRTLVTIGIARRF